MHPHPSWETTRILCYTCKEQIHSASATPNSHSMEKHLAMKLDTFTHYNGLLYKHAMDAIQKFLVLVIPKSSHFKVLTEAHNKLGHQGVTECITSLYNSPAERGWTRTFANTLLIVPCARGKKAKMKMYPLQMMAIPDWSFDKTAIGLVTDLNVFTSILTIIDH